MPYASGRSSDQFIRLAVIEGHIAYVPPSLYDLMQRTSINPCLTEIGKAEELRRLLLLTEAEYRIARLRGLEIVVDYELQGVGE